MENSESESNLGQGFLPIMQTVFEGAWAASIIAMSGLSKEDIARKRIDTGWRGWMKHLVHVFSQGIAISLGIFWRRHGHQAKVEDAWALIMAPHSTPYDSGCILFMESKLLCYCVVRAHADTAPFIGRIAKCIHPIYVHREEKESRSRTIAELTKRANAHGEWGQLLIFPEGTTTNRQALISFKPGAFIPGLPVQPIVVRWPDDFDTVTWTWDGPGFYKIIYLTMCKPWTILDVDFLPVYRPNAAERADAHLFAANVRQVMADHLKVPTTDHSYEDCRLMELAGNSNFMLKEEGLVEFRRLQHKLGLDFPACQRLLEKFGEMSCLNEENGLVTVEVFAKYLNVPVCEPLRELFKLYDRDNSGNIDFREYVIGVSLMSEQKRDDQAVKLAFKLFDKGAKGFVTRSEFSNLCRDTLNCTDEDAAVIFDQVDTQQNGQITLNEFEAYESKMPEFASLFSTYHHIKLESELRTVSPAERRRRATTNRPAEISSDPEDSCGGSEHKASTGSPSESPVWESAESGGMSENKIKID